MTEIFLPPMRVEYHGRDADHHRLDLHGLAISLGGISRVLRSASYVVANGDIPPKHFRPTVRFFAKPPEHGCFPFDIVGTYDGDMFQAASEVFAAVGFEAIQRTVSTVFLLAGGRGSEVDAHIAKILELQGQMEADRHEEQMALIGRWADSEQRVLDTFKALAENYGACPMKERTRLSSP